MPKSKENEVFEDASYDEGFEEEDTEEDAVAEIDHEMLTAGKLSVVGFKWLNDKCDVKFQCGLSSGLVATFKIEGSQVPPHPELVEILQQLQPELAREAEVAFKKTNPIIVTQIIKGHKNGKSSYRIFGLYGRAESRTPMNISSALKWDKHADEKQVMDSETVHLLDLALEQVNQYVQLHLQPADGPDLFGNEGASVLDKSGAKVTTENGAPELAESNEPKEEVPF